MYARTRHDGWLSGSISMRRKKELDIPVNCPHHELRAIPVISQRRSSLPKEQDVGMLEHARFHRRSPIRLPVSQQSPWREEKDGGKHADHWSRAEEKIRTYIRYPSGSEGRVVRTLSASFPNQGTRERQVGSLLVYSSVSQTNPRSVVSQSHS